jgi:DNA-directed RNA polymerase specialized sigma24 family protein
MFSLYRSGDAKRKERLYGELTTVPIIREDAEKLGAAIGHLQEKHRRALHWYYLKGRSPSGAAMQLMVPLKRLAELVIEARAELIQRGA